MLSILICLAVVAEMNFVLQPEKLNSKKGCGLPTTQNATHAKVIVEHMELHKGAVGSRNLTKELRAKAQQRSMPRLQTLCRFNALSGSLRYWRT